MEGPLPTSVAQFRRQRRAAAGVGASGPGAGTRSGDFRPVATDPPPGPHMGSRQRCCAASGGCPRTGGARRDASAVDRLSSAPARRRSSRQLVGGSLRRRRAVAGERRRGEFQSGEGRRGTRRPRARRTSGAGKAPPRPDPRGRPCPRRRLVDQLSGSERLGGCLLALQLLHRRGHEALVDEVALFAARLVADELLHELGETRDHADVRLLDVDE
jgi:hypothetical protein